MRRLVRVGVTRETVIAALTPDDENLWHRCKDGLPPGAQLIAWTVDSHGTFWLTFEHETFPPVEDNGIIPELETWFETTRTS